MSQARAAFAFCVIAASVALMVLLGGTSVVEAAAATGTQVAVAALTAVGTMLSGFVAHTYQRQYSAATRQMNFYYGQPLVHCYLLHAEWLATPRWKPAVRRRSIFWTLYGITRARPRPLQRTARQAGR